MIVKNPDVKYYLFLALNHFLMPMFIQDVATATLIIFVSIPMISFIISILYGVNKGFDIKFISIGIIIVFLSFFAMLRTNYMYIVMYSMAICLGDFFGMCLRKVVK